MIKYFIDLFTKPKYQWTTLDEWAMIGLIVVIAIILGIMTYIILSCYESICDTKWSKCKNARLDGFGAYKCQKKQCMFCNEYKKKEKSNGRKNTN